MVDYDDAAAAVQNPDADPIVLAKIAYENPEFGANVAANPRAYPGLLRWIAEFGDERARQVAAERGYTASATPLGAQQPVAEQKPDIQQQASAATQESPIRLSYQQPNQHGFSAEMAVTTTDQMQMAQIAQTSPELHISLASNPNLYPALADWLAGLDDPAISAALATRNQWTQK